MTSLSSEGVRERWQSFLRRDQASVLCDLRPSVNIRAWLCDSNLQIRYAVIGVESQVGVVRLLVFQIENSTEASRIYLAPVSRLYSSAILLWFAEAPDMLGRARRDDTLGDLPLIRATAAHILLEERIFTFTSGDTE